MNPDYPLNLNFGEEELNSSIQGSLSEASVSDSCLKQVAVYRAHYLELVLENNELSKEILVLQDQIRSLRCKLEQGGR